MNSGSANGKVIITCAVTGAIHTPTMTPHLPITPEEIMAAAEMIFDRKKSVTGWLLTEEEAAQ